MKTRLATRVFLMFGISSVILTAAIIFASRRAATEGFAVFVERGSTPTDGVRPELHTHEEAQSTFDRSLLTAAVSIGAVTLMTTALLSIWISGPLRRLTRTADQIRRGDLTARIEPPSVQEIGDVALSLNALAADLEQNEALRQGLIHDVQHELRTPLNALRGQIEAIQDGLLPTDGARLASLHSNVVQLSALIDDLQVVARAEAGELSLELQPLDLDHEVTTLLADLDAGEHGARATVFVQLASKPQVLADRTRLRQILSNLIQNAWAHTDPTGEIRVQSVIAHERIQISLIDNGSGIAAEHLPHIFERLYRADPSRDRKTGGSGLGLSVTRRLTEALGGTIRIESEEGNSTAVYLTLPKANRDSNPAIRTAR